MPRRPQDQKVLELFGARLRALREARGLTQQRLSEVLKVRASTVSQIETGDLSPTLTTVAALARGLGVEMADLFTPGPAPLPPDNVEEHEATDAFRDLTPERRVIVLALLRTLRT